MVKPILVRLNVIDDNRKILPAKYNKVFLALFSSEQYKEKVLLQFLRSYLKRPSLEADEITIGDPRLPIEDISEKSPVVDVLIHVPDGIIHIEMQFCVNNETRDRLFYYHTRSFSAQLNSGEEYRNITQVITLCITSETLIKEDDFYFHSFTPYDPTYNVILTDKSVLQTLELSKLPQNYDGSAEWIWGTLINAEEEDKLDMLANTYPEVAGAVKVIKDLSADPMFRIQTILSEKARTDWMSYVRYARKEGLEVGHAAGKDEGRTEGLSEGQEKVTINAIRFFGMTDPASVSSIGGISVERARELIRQYGQP
ncbi:hypothetical protein AGMMS49992_02200 [Clostridia bacterium]|nr:hypothetical protein AGMMS49992_02200 [Clostridia bacterium]